VGGVCLGVCVGVCSEVCLSVRGGGGEGRGGGGGWHQKLAGGRKIPLRTGGGSAQPARRARPPLERADIARCRRGRAELPGVQGEHRTLQASSTRGTAARQDGSVPARKPFRRTGGRTFSVGVGLAVREDRGRKLAAAGRRRRRRPASVHSQGRAARLWRAGGRAAAGGGHARPVVFPQEKGARQELQRQQG
jgi:hypothetical protein